MKDYSDMCIIDLMKVPTEELKELTIEEFAKVIDGKRVNIHPFTDKNILYVHGDIYISAMDANVLVKNEDGENRINIFEWDSHISINLSERIVFGIYSYGNNKSYRIAFEGNSPDLLLTVTGGRIN